MGAERFRLSFARENIVLDHKTISRMTLRRLDAERKEKQRVKRQSARDVTTVIALTENEHVTTNNVRPDLSGAYDYRRDVTTVIVGNYLENYLEEDSTEVEGYPLHGSEPVVGNSYALAKEGLDPDRPFPIPANDDEADHLIEVIRAGRPVNPAVMKYWRIKLSAGELTPSLVEAAFRRVA